MLCQNCKAKQANTHIKRTINGETQEFDLCSECAAKMGFSNSFESLFDVGSMMSGFFGVPSMSKALAREEKCPFCGMTFSQISKSGKVGCAKCYETFYDRLIPSIKRIHGNTIHTGKKLRTARLASGTENTSSNQQTAAKTQNSIAELSERLAEAVKKQEFEIAAQLRDEINQLKSEKGGEQ